MSVASAKESPTFRALTMAIETFQMNRSLLFFVRERKKSGHVQHKENILFLQFSSNNPLNRDQQTRDNKYQQF